MESALTLFGARNGEMARFFCLTEFKARPKSVGKGGSVAILQPIGNDKIHILSHSIGSEALSLEDSEEHPDIGRLSIQNQAPGLITLGSLSGPFSAALGPAL